MARPKTINEPVEEEKLAEAEAEIMPHHATEASADEAAGNVDEQAEVETSTEEGADLDQALPAEVTAIHVGNESATDLNNKESDHEKSKLERKKDAKAERLAAKSEKIAASKEEHEAKSRHSKKFLAAKAKVEPGKLYQMAEALTLIKELSVSKFDGSIEIHLRLNKKKAKGSTESSRGVVHMPHGTGKDKKVVVLDEKMIEEIAKTKKLDFDICIASPELMPKVAKIAKILGPKGKMPDPKSGTVTNDPKKVMEEIKSGKTEYRVDASGIVHQIIGKVSWEDAKLIENAKVVMAIYPKSRLNSAFITASIAPSIPLDLSKF
ncbi:MAG: hypothetical protein Q7K33_00900 [Candidatus Berkelbacteria bacterium]|nr:hypothetical protein [Candidatus Berkelbacteria bacterium]